MVVFCLSVYVSVLLHHFVLFSVLVHDLLFCLLLFMLFPACYVYLFLFLSFLVFNVLHRYCHFHSHVFVFILWYACFCLLFPSVYDLWCFMFSSYHSSGSLYFIVFRFDLIGWGVIKIKCLTFVLFVYYILCALWLYILLNLFV